MVIWREKKFLNLILLGIPLSNSNVYSRFIGRQVHLSNTILLHVLQLIQNNKFMYSNKNNVFICQW